MDNNDYNQPSISMDFVYVESTNHKSKIFGQGYIVADTYYVIRPI